MSALIRDASFGQLVRWATKNKYLQYPEEQEGWTCPKCYNESDHQHPNDRERDSADSTIPSPGAEDSVEKKDPESPQSANPIERYQTPLQLARTLTDEDGDEVGPTATRTHSNLSRVSTRQVLQQSSTHADLEKALTDAISMEYRASSVIRPNTLEDGTILVDWYTTDDPDNPQNWTLSKKVFTSVQIYLYTFAVYCGSAILSAAEPGIVIRFGVSLEAASLVLALYVFAYGVGPLIFSPLSEIPSVGRNPPYMISFAIFVILCIPAAVVDNFAGLLVLRFLTGFFGSPCLATGGASLQDLFSFIKVPYAILVWAFAATAGPALGPTISGFSVAAEGWRWALWEMLWMAGPVWLLMFFCLPETSPSTILLRRAQRLRKVTGDQRLKSQSEIDQAKMKPRDVVIEALVRPIELMVKDPVIAYVDLYIALCYGIYYSFFEAFPRVYEEIYGFNLGELGLAFLPIAVASALGCIGYASYVYFVIEPDIRANGLGAPERRLRPALFSSFLIPIGLFLFAWTGRSDVPWIVTSIGIGLFTLGIFTLFQCIFIYLPFSYPQYAASLFAGNDFARSSLAAAAILFASPLFNNLGVPKGVSLVASLTGACVVGIWVLYFYGDRLRARSKFAAK